MRTGPDSGKPRRPMLTTKESQTLAGLFSRIEPQKRPGTDTTARETDTFLESERKAESERNMADQNQDQFADISSILDSVMQNIKPHQQSSGNDSKVDDQFGGNAPSADRISVKHQGRTIYLPDSDEEIPHLLDSGELTLADAIGLITKRETAKIDAELRAAVRRGEDYFWEVCQERVFSQAHYLSSAEEDPSSVNESKQADDKHVRSTPAQEGPASQVNLDSTETSSVVNHPDQAGGQNASGAPILDEIFAQTDPDSTEHTSPFNEANQPVPKNPLDVPDCVPLGIVVAGTYRTLLREAFLLLNLHFPSSPFLTEYRTRIISLGRSSAVLGLSTALFNDMLFFHWRVTHDFVEIVSLIREMDIKGARPIRSTFRIFDGIERERKWAMKQKNRGRVLDEPWWDLPKNRKALSEMFDGENGLIPELRRRDEDKSKKWQVFVPFV
ncbi:hypothetical protein BDV18DRAFT_128621 [Aspergillus unguis]